MPNMIYKFTLSIMLFVLPILNVNAASLVGTWKLSSFEMHASNKQLISCHSPTGLLTYTSTGYVAVGFNCMQADNSKQPSFKLDDMTFYTGKYQVKGNKVIHFTQNGSSPDYYNKKLVRQIDLLTAKKLVLSLKQKGNSIVVKWDRVG